MAGVEAALAAAIAGTTALATTGVQVGSAAHANKKQREWMAKQQRKQNEWNLDMWNRQNEYNSPAAQMQRFTDAGLNPNLVYSEGNPGTATSAPQSVNMGTPDFQGEARGISEGVSKLFGLVESFKLQEQLRAMKADADIKEEQATQAGIQTSNMIDERDKWLKVAQQYDIDPSTGNFVPRSFDDFAVLGGSTALSRANYLVAQNNGRYATNAQRSASLEAQAQFINAKSTGQGYLNEGYSLNNQRTRFFLSLQELERESLLLKNNQLRLRNLGTSQYNARYETMNKYLEEDIQSRLNVLKNDLRKSDFYSEPWRMELEFWLNSLGKGLDVASKLSRY